MRNSTLCFAPTAAKHLHGSWKSTYIVFVKATQQIAMAEHRYITASSRETLSH